MDDTTPVSSPLSTRQGFGVDLPVEQEGQDHLTPLLRSRRPSRHVVVSPPHDASLPRSYRPRADTPASADPWPERPSPCPGGSLAQTQAGPSTTRPPLGLLNINSPEGETLGCVLSGDTVRRLPLTPFPPWRSNSDRERGETAHQGGGDHDRCCCDGEARREGLGRDLRREGVLAALLAVQFAALLGVVSVWVGLAVGGGDAGSTTFWHSLCMYFQPLVGGLALFVLVVMLVYEICGLSDAVFLGVQVVVLVVTSMGGFCVAWWAVGQGSRVVVGTAVGTGILMLGVGILGFVRGLVVWWLG